jgi:CMP-N-acetylneuraminic acid synthetase
LPGKNIVDFFGKPVIAYTIEASLDSGLFDRVVVSTEDAEIAEVSSRFGALVGARPPQLATDDAHLVDVILDLLDREAAAGRDYDQFCMVHATAPLRRADDIRAVMALLEPGACDFAAAFTNYNLPPYQALKVGDDGLLSPMWPELIAIQSHNLPPMLAGNGSTYAASVPAFREQIMFFGAPLKGHLMDAMHSIDIDTAEDLEIARLIKSRLDEMDRR